MLIILGSLGFAVVAPIYWGSLLQKAQFPPPHVENHGDSQRPIFILYFGEGIDDIIGF
jgi:hypothetical protein